MIRPEILASRGAFLWPDGSVGSLVQLDAGTLRVRSGILGMGDPATYGGGDPAVIPRLDVPLGDHRVSVALARWERKAGQTADRDVTAVVVDLAAGAVDHWEPWQADGVPVRLQVDGGIGAMFDFADVEACNTLWERLEVLDPLYEYRDTPWFLWHRGVLAFRCGRGDGAYQTWLGTTSDGNLTKLVLDLELLANVDDSSI